MQQSHSQSKREKVSPYLQKQLPQIQDKTKRHRKVKKKDKAPEVSQLYAELQALRKIKNIREQHKRLMNMTRYSRRCSVVRNNINQMGNFGRTATYSLCKTPYEGKKTIKFLDEKSNMEHYIRKSLMAAGWRKSPNNSEEDSRLLWSNSEQASHLACLKPHQFYNHIGGSHILTSKDKLHELLTSKNPSFYPRTFLIPSEYDDFIVKYQSIGAMIVLAEVSRRIEAFLKIEGDLELICLNKVLKSSAVYHLSQQSKLLLKMCLYFELVRQEKGYEGYFENCSDYENIQIHHRQKLFADILKLDQKLDFEQVQHSVLLLVLNYDRMLSRHQRESENSWVVKPIASSRGAGMMVLASGEFYSCQNQLTYFKNCKKYTNKLIQKYIANPYLLKDPIAFAGRKFDIRQWVLITGRSEIYRYHNAYCRFASQKYTMAKLNQEIHLTNYSLAGKDAGETVMMLDDLFQFAPPHLKSTYRVQMDAIIRETIQSATQLQQDPRCFELFGFDVIFDQNGKLWLLEVNLNPACSHERDAKLKQEAEKMVPAMFSLVMEAKDCDQWVIVSKTGKMFEQQQSQIAKLNLNPTKNKMQMGKKNQIEQNKKQEGERKL